MELCENWIIWKNWNMKNYKLFNMKYKSKKLLSTSFLMQKSSTVNCKFCKRDLKFFIDLLKIEIKEFDVYFLFPL